MFIAVSGARCGPVPLSARERCRRSTEKQNTRRMHTPGRRNHSPVTQTRSYNRSCGYHCSSRTAVGHSTLPIPSRRTPRSDRMTTFDTYFIMLRPLGGALSDDAVWRLTSVWRLSVAYIGPKARTETHRKTKIGTEVVSRLPLDAMRGSLFDLTTGRISHCIL